MHDQMTWPPDSGDTIAPSRQTTSVCAMNVLPTRVRSVARATSDTDSRGS